MSIKLCTNFTLCMVAMVTLPYNNVTMDRELAEAQQQLREKVSARKLVLLVHKEFMLYLTNS